MYCDACFHDQVADISQYVKELNRSNYDLGLDSDSFRFHMGPLIRQVADLICTVRLIEVRLQDGGELTKSENRFFGGQRDFQRNILKRIKRKEI